MMLGEQETIIRWDEEDKLIRWYSCSTVQLRRMEKMAARYPGQFRLVRRTDDSAWYEFAPGLLRIRKPMSDAQREACQVKALRMREMRLTRNALRGE